MGFSDKWSTKQLTPGRRAWVRLLQALGKTAGEGRGTESEGCGDSGAAQRAERLSQKSTEIVNLVAEKEMLKQQLREAMIPPCPDKVRQIVTQSFRSIQLEEIKGNG